MELKALSHTDFDVMCYEKSINDDTVENFTNDAFISIICTEECRKYYLEDDTSHWFKNHHNNVLNLEFDDLTEDFVYKGHLFKAMNEEQADKCVEFIENNIGKNIFVHCTAGISRSGALVSFIHDFYNENNCYDRFKNDNSQIRPNNHVLTLLKRAYYKKHDMFIE